MGDVAELMRTERLALIELLEQLEPQDWTTPSLCEGWTVLDVAAHLAYAPVMSPVRTVTELVRGWGSINRMIHDSAVRDAQRGRGKILTQLRKNAETGAKPVGMPQITALSDAVVHQLDIRRPLGESRAIPEAAFKPTADFFAGTGFPGSLVVGGNVRTRIAGLRVVVDGIDWSHGEGPEVRGSSEAVMLMLAGRPVGAEEFSGPGAPKLFSRLLRHA